MLEIHVGIVFLCWRFRRTHIFKKKSLKTVPFPMPEKVLWVSFARYAFCGHKPFSCILLGESPKTPDILIGAPLFDAPFQINKYHSETTSSIICLSILLLTYVLPKHVHHNIFFFVFINNLEANIFVHLHCIVCFLYCQGSFLISSFF